MAITIAYFIALFGAAAFACAWLLRFDRRTPDGGFVRPRQRRRMVTSLVVAILLIMGSATFVMFALIVGGLFRMI